MVTLHHENQLKANNLEKNLGLDTLLVKRFKNGVWTGRHLRPETIDPRGKRATGLVNLSTIVGVREVV